MATSNIIDILLDLAAIEEEQWEEISAAIPPWHPRNSDQGGSGSGEGGGGGDGGGSGSSGSGSSGSSGDNDDDDDDDDDSATGKKDIDWKAMARKHERAAKKERQRAEAAERKVQERETADQSEHEKAVEDARKEGERTAAEAAEKERRADRLENATLKLAGKGFKVKQVVKGEDGEEEEKEVVVKFADSDDAVTYVERMLRRGELDEDDLFNDQGRVDTDALSEALQELIEDKPHLRAGTSSGNGKDSGGREKVKGGADGGKGKGSPQSIDKRSAEDWFKTIRQHK